MKKACFVILLSFLLCCKTEKPLEKNIAVGEAMGTTYAITYFAKGQVDLQNEIESVFAEVYQSMSTYIPNSDISRINSGDSTIVVDDMFKKVFEVSKKVHKASNGYFDPTVGVLVNAWGFGPGESIILDSTKVDSLLQFVGFDKVSLTKKGRIKKLNPAIEFDFNAVAKGYSIDLLGNLLDERGYKNYLVEVGGEILTKGTNVLSGKRWTVGIDNPTDLSYRGSAAVVSLENKALASSGNYRKFRIDERTGEKYVHSVDPKTGYTKNSNVLATTVLAKDCASADAFATAFMVMELEDTKAYLKSDKDVDAFIIFIGDDGTTQSYMTPGFENSLVRMGF
ncbi:FAD:protein FMN transferase [Croceivirga thetidis]|uniref:FAD:protein FMN transferase n=1 Tax=Croceivirga thetidis TaxID=2721623 RepID=A0ABX1GK92_9FLAO|nr:FAD:protein FMN transferase [Croceivirga thetidis]NKI30335.1 FAD:protein FMN transferase [Croceivirga thetidis]